MALLKAKFDAVGGLHKQVQGRLEAEKLIINNEMRINKPDKVIIHHSASRISTTVGQISTWHKVAGFFHNKEFNNYVGYHYVILHNGRIVQTKLLKDEGCHCKQKNQNAKSIGICVIGNFEKIYPSSFQISSLMSLIDYLNKSYGKFLPVFSHCDFSATLCPGKNLKGFVKILGDENIMKQIYK